MIGANFGCQSLSTGEQLITVLINIKPIKLTRVDVLIMSPEI